MLATLACGTTPTPPPGPWRLTDIEANSVSGLVRFEDRFIVAVVPQEIGSGQLYASRDGLAWDSLAGPPDSPAAIAAGDPGLLMITMRGEAGAISYLGWRSEDGSTWEPVDISMVAPDTSWVVDGLVWTGRAFVAISHRREVTGSVVAFTSRDGVKWARSDSGLNNETFRVETVTAGDGRVVVLGHGYGSVVLYESDDDGRTWRSAEHWFIEGAGAVALVPDGILIGACQVRQTDRGQDQAVMWSLAAIDARPTMAVVDGNRAADAPATCVSAIDVRGDTITAFSDSGGTARVWTSTGGAGWVPGSTYHGGGPLYMTLAGNDGTRTIAAGNDYDPWLKPQGNLLVWTTP